MGRNFVLDFENSKALYAHRARSDCAADDLVGNREVGNIGWR
jgi:hypothetical protein